MAQSKAWWSGETTELQMHHDHPVEKALMWEIVLGLKSS
jgi:hypothetical protein